jgi:hypothetical protein
VRPKHLNTPTALKGLVVVVVVVVVCIACPVSAREQGPAREKFEAALRCYAKLRLDCSLDLLQEAKELSSEPGLLGRIHLYLGVHHAVLGKIERAQAAFRTALTHDPTVELDPEQFKRSLVNLFRRVRRRMQGKLRVHANRGAEVLVDGARRGEVPFLTRLPVGRHRVSVRLADGTAHSEEVVIAVDKEARVIASFEPAPARDRPLRRRQRRLWTWVAAGSAAATLAVAVGLGASASADHDAWQEELGRDRIKWDELRDAVEAKATAANALFVVGGVLAATSAVLFFVEGGRERRARRVGLSGSATGLFVSGTF